MRIIDLSSAVCSSDRQTGCRLSPDVPAASPSSRPRSVSRRRFLSSQPPAGTRCEDERRQWRGFVDRPADHRNASWRRVGLYSAQRDFHHGRSEEHTSELQSLMRLSYAVFYLKTKKQININNHTTRHTQPHSAQQQHHP